MDSTRVIIQQRIAPANEPHPELWEEAYERVEAYFAALQIRNKLLLSRLVSRVLERAAKRLAAGESVDATTAAIEEVERVLETWFREVLERPDTPTPELLRRGRLALLIAHVPERWPLAFLAPAPWPAAFIKEVRAAYIDAGPQFQGAPMKARRIDFGPLSSIAESSLRRLERWPLVKTSIVWGGLCALFAWLFWLTR